MKVLTVNPVSGYELVRDFDPLNPLHSLLGRLAATVPKVVLHHRNGAAIPYQLQFDPVVDCPLCGDDAEHQTAPGPAEPLNEYTCTSCGCSFTMPDRNITAPAGSAS